uniref:Uncharacterized protein n=1 Tax=Polynucleobacter necessarius subsp. necessarius (strain STIR1) TaxID=452638 RepID=B1XU87_POLNS
MFGLLYPFSKTYTKYSFQINDGGRQKAGFKGRAGDCVVRSIAIAANLPYIKVYEDLRLANERDAELRNDQLAKRLSIKGSSPRNGNHRNVFHNYILTQGFEWVPTMKIGAGCQVHLRPDELPDGVLIAKVSKHLTAIINGVIHDTHDPSRHGNRCVYGYYIKRCQGLSGGA